MVTGSNGRFIMNYSASSLTDIPEDIQSILQKHPSVWRGSDSQAFAYGSEQGYATGYEALDKLLPAGGWPRQGLTEVIAPRWGIGELQLLLPMMKSMTQMKRWVVWVAPPFEPYAPALVQAGVDLDYLVVIRADSRCADALWSVEKALQSSACAMVLTWLNWLPNGVLRRLQLAAQNGGAMGVLFRRHEVENSPVSLRMRLERKHDGLQVQLLKARGSLRRRNVHLSVH